MASSSPEKSTCSVRKRVPGLFGREPNRPGPKSPGDANWMDILDAPKLSSEAIAKMPEKIRQRLEGGKLDPMIVDIWNKMYTLLFTYARFDDWILADTLATLFLRHYGTIADTGYTLSDKIFLLSQFSCKDTRAFCMAFQEWVDYWWDPLGRLRLRLRPIAKPPKQLVASSNQVSRPNKGYLAKLWGNLAFKNTVEQTQEEGYDSDEDEEYFEQFTLPPRPNNVSKDLNENVRRWVYWVVLRHFPIEGCTIQEISQAFVHEVGRPIDQQQIQLINTEMHDVLRIETKSAHHELVRVRFDIDVTIPSELKKSLGIEQVFAHEKMKTNKRALSELENPTPSTSNDNGEILDQSFNVPPNVAQTLVPNVVVGRNLIELPDSSPCSSSQSLRPLETVRLKLSEALSNESFEKDLEKELDCSKNTEQEPPSVDTSSHMEPTMVKLVFLLLNASGQYGLREETIQRCVDLCHAQYGLWNDLDQADLVVNQVIDSDVERISSQPMRKYVWIRTSDFSGQSWSTLIVRDNSTDDATDAFNTLTHYTKLIKEHIEQLGFSTIEARNKDNSPPNANVSPSIDQHSQMPQTTEKDESELDRELDKSGQIQLLVEMMFNLLQIHPEGVVLNDMKVYYSEMKYTSMPPYATGTLFTRKNFALLIEYIASRPDVVELYKNLESSKKVCSPFSIVIGLADSVFIFIFLR